MKELITEELNTQIRQALSSINGVEAAFGKPIKIEGKEIIPVASVRIRLTANSEGQGGGNVESKADAKKSGLAGLMGGGGGSAGAGGEILVSPIGFIKNEDGKLVFLAL